MEDSSYYNLYIIMYMKYKPCQAPPLLLNYETIFHDIIVKQCHRIVVIVS